MKNFFKAMLIGILEGMKAFGGILWCFISFGLVVFGPFASICIIIKKLCSFLMYGDDVSTALYIIVAIPLGFCISNNIVHALKAYKYAKEHQCDIQMAWKETISKGCIDGDD